MNKIDLKFLGVGAPRTGTTSFTRYLSQHPHILFNSDKLEETGFFAFADNPPVYTGPCYFDFISQFSDYCSRFDFSRPHQYAGEISTQYLYHHHSAIANIKKYVLNPEELRILIILRNPVETAFSSYRNQYARGLENLTFSQALDIEPDRIRQNIHWALFYTARYFYYEQVKAYLENFKYVKIYLHEELLSNMQGVLNDFMVFLGEKESFPFDTSQWHNASVAYKSKSLQNKLDTQFFIPKKYIRLFIPAFLRKKGYAVLSSLNVNRDFTSSDEERKRLISIFSSDISKLSSLIGRDLSHWLK
jgi:hypothetical protein